VPQIPLILYIMHLYIQKRGYTVLEKNTDNPMDMSILSAPRTSNGGKVARETTQNCLKLRLSKTGFISPFETLLGRFLHGTDSLGELLFVALQKARKLNKAPPTHLIGFELLNVVYQKQKLELSFLSLTSLNRGASYQ
jgi:hypothetical protein